jgi:hypothetical protein
LKFRSLETNRLQPAKTLHLRFATSYITGAHNVKVGINHTSGWNGFTYGNLNSLSYRLNNAIPNQLSERAFPIITDTNMEHNMGVFAQDKWTIRQLTRPMACATATRPSAGPNSSSGHRCSRRRAISAFPAQHGFISWHDITPHLGAAYDVFGKERRRQGELQPLSREPLGGRAHRAGSESAQQPHHADDEVVERRQSRLRAGLQPHEPGRQR